MNRGNAVSVSETSLIETYSLESASSLQPNAIIYPWRPSPDYLTRAMDRAFSFRYRFLKRTVDIVLSSLLLVILFPVGFVVALAVALSSPGPIFYREQRMGRFRVPFRIIKFRSMYIAQQKSNVLDISKAQRSPADAGRCQKRGRDARITSVGRVLRRMSLDELPQLWNVLIGDMSLVGPRPIVEAERRFYGRNLPYYDLFCPGITGLWQVSGRSDVDYDKRVLFDREYASQWSCLLDLAILARTIPAVVMMRGAY